MRDIDNIDRNVHLLAALSKKSIEQIEQLSFAQISSQIASVNFMDTMPKAKPSRWFTLKGKVFSVYLNPSDLTYGQFVDLTVFTKDKDSIIENMHKILAVICVPMLRSYNGKTFQKRADFFYKHMPVSFAYGLALFFCRLLKDSVIAIEDYLESQAAQQMNKAKISMQNIGGG